MNKLMYMNCQKCNELLFEANTFLELPPQINCKCGKKYNFKDILDHTYINIDLLPEEEQQSLRESKMKERFLKNTDVLHQMKPIHLEQCPFCGKSVNMISTYCEDTGFFGHYVYHSSSNCILSNFQTPIQETVEDAANAWNRRI